MAQILIRGLDDGIVARLKSRAETHGRSLEGEARSILESAAGFTAEEARRVASDWQIRLGNRPMASSGELLAEDRRR